MYNITHKDYTFVESENVDFNNYIGAVLEHIINETMDDKLAEDIIGHNKPDTNTHS